jgi:hypothetical protein
MMYYASPHPPANPTLIRKTTSFDGLVDFSYLNSGLWKFVVQQLPPSGFSKMTVHIGSFAELVLGLVGTLGSVRSALFIRC